MTDYYDGLNTKLLQSIPPNARQVLELGCANGRLGQAYKTKNPTTIWTGIDFSKEATETAKTIIDHALCMDLNKLTSRDITTNFDVIVIGDLLEHIAAPNRLLEVLQEISSVDAKIICCIPNVTHASVMHRLLTGDFSYDQNGLLDQTHTKLFSASSAFKLFLDSGWIPDTSGEYRTTPANNDFTTKLIEAANCIGVPQKTAVRQLGLYQIIITAYKWPMQVLLRPGQMEPFSVIVPVSRPWQFDLNIARSPGLKEVNADIIVVENAQNAADAYAKGAAKSRHPWRVLAHQDVYFPTGSGYTIARQLGELTEKALHHAPAGFAGIERPQASGSAVHKVGCVVDRQQLFWFGPSHSACSIDEFCVALHRDAKVDIDPNLGWHLWATDLCLQAQENGLRGGNILEVPLFHNSLNDFNLPTEFHQSADNLLKKHPHMKSIPTLCGNITRQTNIVHPYSINTEVSCL